MCKEQIKAIFKKFDQYASIKDDSWYKDYKKELGIEEGEMMDKAEIEYWITKLPIHQLRELLISIQNEIDNRE